ncbi:mating-type protein [Rhizopogon vinicolor AM-OR11-026]|uniref:Mating-type protein n=1 Tax=Rhizopogon vinicolor AM-OR11-026 TaxID=1314800 RepID=A0A1B7NE29_9AGAM|nr:mating-type protein [Rhizopogon vinicolor AM-OR11-026]
MDKDIQRRFQQAEDTLLDSISRGDDSLMLFDSAWSSLYADFSRCLSAGELSEDTISIADSVAASVGIIAKYFFDSHKTHEESRNQLLDDLGSILDGFTRVTISPSSVLTTQNTHSLESSLPPFIEPAYKWLLSNIHNPYPSSDTKGSIAKSSGSSMNSVSAWFISARRRIGWTTICRKHFDNRRAETLDAAYRALVKEDPSIALPQTVFHDFIQMKAAAQDLYASTFTKSALAGDLDVVVKDMTEEDRLQLEQEKKEHAQEEKKRREEEKEIRRKQRALERQAQMALTAFASYPSPSHSRSPSPVPTLEESWTDESEDDEDVNPPVLAGRKRRASSELTDSRQSPCMDRPMKRLRVKTPEAVVETPALPSPLSTTDGLDSSDEIETVAPPCPSGSSRKRRLSDGDSHSVPKRPRGVLVGPRVHAVSDPLPRPESGIDDWFQTNFFEIPPPVENIGFDQSTPLDIEVFSGYTFSDMQENSMPTLADVPFERQVADLEVPSHDSFSAPPLDNLNHFLDALSAFAPNNSCIQVTTPFANSIISHPSINLADHIPSGSCSWTDLLNSDQSFLPTLDQFSQSSSCGDLSQILPEIDFSALQLPLSSTTPQPGITSPVDDARLAKLEQLQLLREQARLLEQDLAVSV